MQTRDFPFTRLPLELQYRVLEQYYDAAIEIKVAHHPYIGRHRWLLTFTTDLSAAPLLVSRGFRGKALDVLYAKQRNVLVWSAFVGSSLAHVQIPEHFLRLCSTVSELVLERQCLSDLPFFRKLLPKLSLIELKSVNSVMQTSRTVIESASSVLNVLRGDLDDEFGSAVLEDATHLLMSACRTQTNAPPPETIQINVEGLMFGFHLHFDAKKFWAADDEKERLPGSILVCSSRTVTCTILTNS